MFAVEVNGHGASPGVRGSVFVFRRAQIVGQAVERPLDLAHPLRPLVRAELQLSTAAWSRIAATTVVT